MVPVRIAELSTGYTVNALTDYFFDYVLYPYTVYKLGITAGGITMSLFSVVVCIVLIYFYDWSKRDWLGIESIKKIHYYEGEKKCIRMLSNLLLRHKILIFFFLSIRYDPFICTIYMRKSDFNGMTRKDWFTFTACAIVSNLYWTLICYWGTFYGVFLWNKV